MATNVEQKDIDSSLNIIDDLNNVENAHDVVLSTALNESKKIDNKDGGPLTDLIKKIFNDFKDKLKKDDNDDKTLVEIGGESVEYILRYVLDELPPDIVKDYIDTDSMAEALIEGLHGVSKRISSGIKKITPDDVKKIGRNVRDKYLSKTKGEMKHQIRKETSDVVDYIQNDLPQDAQEIYDTTMSALEQGYNDTVEALQSAQEGLNNAMRTAKEQYNKAQESVKNFFGSLF